MLAGTEGHRREKVGCMEGTKGHEPCRDYIKIFVRSSHVIPLDNPRVRGLLVVLFVGFCRGENMGGKPVTSQVILGLYRGYLWR